MNVSIASPEIGPDERENVLRALDSGQLAAGDEVTAFEREFAEYCDVDHSIATANGTAALHAALEAIDIAVGAYVVTTPFSFVATANAIRFAGGYPLFVDIDPETMNLDPDAVEEAIVDADGPVEAIVVVHLFGLPADMDRFQEIAVEHDIALIEDAAQAHGATYDGQPVGSFGDAGCFSFYPTKNMTTGEGGMVTTDDDDLAAAVRRFIDHGRGQAPYSHVDLGHNYRMTDLEAAMGRAQLEKLPRFVESRRENAAYLTECLAENEVSVPVEPDNCRHAYHQYTLRTSSRDTVRTALGNRGVESAIYYPTTIPDLEAYDRFNGEYPMANEASDTVLSVPVHPSVTTAGLDLVVEGIENRYTAEVES